MTDDEKSAAPPEVRIADADRDAVVARLSYAMGEGRLDVDEFEERSRAAYAAKVASDLVPLTADLPPALTTPPRPAAHPVSAGSPERSPERRWIVSLLGDRRRSGSWQTGDQTVSVSILGSQSLDFTDVGRANVDLVVVTVMGDTDVVVPPSARVQSTGFSLLGDIDDDLGPPTDGEPSIVRIRSYGLLGSVRVRRTARPKRRKWWRFA